MYFYIIIIIGPEEHYLLFFILLYKLLLLFEVYYYIVVNCKYLYCHFIELLYSYLTHTEVYIYTSHILIFQLISICPATLITTDSYLPHYKYLCRSRRCVCNEMLGNRDACHIILRTQPIQLINK